MKTKVIYTTLLVFASLFCQELEAQKEPPTILDTTICVRKGDTIKVYEYEEQILRLLASREKETWSKCCDGISVEFKDKPYIDAPDVPLKQLIKIKDWPAIIIKENTTFSLEVTYIRHLQCSDILKCKEDTSRASVAMWHLFGDLFSETETGTIMRVSDTAFVTTVHKVKLKYQTGMSFPNGDFKIQGDSCFNAFSFTTLKVPEEYSLCRLKWFKPENVDFTEEEYNDTMSIVKLGTRSEDSYLYPVICMAISCSNDTVFDTIQIGKPTPSPKMNNLACIAASETSFNVEVKEPDSRFSYHWSVESLEKSEIIDTQQGASVTMAIPQKEAVKLKLVSTGGCKASDAVTQVLHRSVVAGNIQLQGDTNCVFIGDTLRLSLSETPEETLVWQIAGNTTMLPPHDTYAYPAVQDKDNVVVSVYAKACPNDIITDTFNIREDFRVSLGTSPMCISAKEYQVIGLISNGINPEVHWYGNGVEIDSSTYTKEDSIQLKLTNPGDPNLYVAVTAKECDRERDTLLVLHPKPETPSLDPLLGLLTPCIPLGMSDTIELRVQQQEGVKFKWDFSNTEKFQRIAESDSHSISVATNFGLLDSEEDKTIDINIAAYTEGCSDTLAKWETLYAKGAELEDVWEIGIKKELNGKSCLVGFRQNTVKISSHQPQLDFLKFCWTSDRTIRGIDSAQTVKFQVTSTFFPVNVNCLLTNRNTSCYSYYSQQIEGFDEQMKVNVSTQNKKKTPEEGIRENMKKDNLRSDLKNEISNQIVLAPNPTQGNTLLYLGNVNIEELTVIEIFTEQGVCLYRKTALANIEELPMAKFRSGLYFVRVHTGEEEPVVKKLIVK